MTPKIIYSILFLFILIHISCAPEKCHNKSKIDYHYVDENTLPWFGMFKEGNWWVYEEEKTGLRDSLYIQNYDNTFFGMGCKFTQLIEAKLVSKYIFKTTAKINYNVASDYTTYFKICIDDFCFKSLVYDSLFDNFKDNPIQSITIQGKVYDQVVKMVGQDQYIYLAKDVGIIRIEQNDKVYNFIKNKN